MKTKIIMASTISLILVVFLSCNYLVERTDTNVITTNENIVNTYKYEAKLLVRASEDNLDIIKLSTLLVDAKTDEDIEKLAIQLKKTHSEILKQYSLIANEKLISIPNYSNIDIQIVSNIIESDDYVKTNLNLIVEKINNQIELLSKLKETTNNVELKVLSVRVNTILQSNLNKTENLLSQSI
jgi:hypothetical protein